MKISIVTVSFNSAGTIVDTLQSVASQTYRDIEHIVIDGASSDGTFEIVKDKGRHVTKFVSEPDGGIYDAMNKGLALATGEVVGFLNSDDVFASSGIIAVIAKAFSDQTVDGVYGDLVFVDPEKTDRVVRYWRPGLHTRGACAKGWMVPHPTFYVRRDILLRTGGFSLDYKLQSDFEMMLRLFEVERITASYLPQTLVRMRMGGATTGSFGNILRGNIEAAKACRRNGYPGGVSFVAQKLVRRLPQFLNRPSP